MRSAGEERKLRKRKAIFAAAIVLGAVAVAVGYRTLRPRGGAEQALAGTPEAAAAGAAATPEDEAHSSFLYGRITTIEGTTYEGRLRWGGGQEAFWGDFFNGARRENPWLAHVPPERLPKDRRGFELFGLQFGVRETPNKVSRLFLARFGDIAGIEATAREVRVRLKSGGVFMLDRFEASDFDDGVRVWDGRLGVTDLDSLRIRAIEFLPAGRRGRGPDRLHATVHTRRGAEFTGFVQWDHEQCLGSDELTGLDAEGKERRLRFDAIRAIAPQSQKSSVVALLDGEDLVLAGNREVSQGNRGVFVDDTRYGRVLVSWAAVERVVFDRAGSGPGYGEFPAGGPLKGSVTTTDGRRLAGRLVFDLDESEITETLDAPSAGVDYLLPFGLVASIALPGQNERESQPARVTLLSGEELKLECRGDLGPGNAGLLVFAEGGGRPEYVRWSEVHRVELEQGRAVYPAVSRR